MASAKSKRGNPVRTVTQADGTQIQVIDLPNLEGTTDGVQFEGHAAKAVGTAKFGDVCRCGASRLLNIIATEEDIPKAKSRNCVIKCHNCQALYYAPLPTVEDRRIDRLKDKELKNKK